MLIGYARVSSKEQNLDRQLLQLKNFGCEYIVEEKASGKNRYERQKFQELLQKYTEELNKMATYIVNQKI